MHPTIHIIGFITVLLLTDLSVRMRVFEHGSIDIPSTTNIVSCTVFVEGILVVEPLYTKHCW